MIRLFQVLAPPASGLASSGAWGCFDEFNRLVPEVLSVCSLQFKAVTDGLRAYSASYDNREDRLPQYIVIEDDRVSLNPGCGVFITMNPGYLGRSELPEGLKVNGCLGRGAHEAVSTEDKALTIVDMAVWELIVQTMPEK